MCVSTAPAEFTGTTLYAGRLTHPEHGLIHVLGYQNTAVNHADGPNAMLLHLPAVGMTPENFVSVGHHSDLLSRMVEAVRPVVPSDALDDGIAWMGYEEPPAVHVFEHDVYTVLLADDPTLIPAALARVPFHKRPVLAPELFAFYAEAYPDHAVAVCCFDNAQARQAKPLLLWYEPLDADELTLPALDCHTGAAPDPGVPVPTDHWLLFGSDEVPADWGVPVSYPQKLRHSLLDYLPQRIVGTYCDEPLPNGDFVLRHQDLLDGRLEAVRRLVPDRPLRPGGPGAGH
ncbi:hypothetical protein ACGFMM_09300 [Streptomyces sp. NPDC048604]|uniref:hypothetical protein n=1 Tax=Streptomyces sp. NPDC048604 TaxID=3365578 RepID=UPI0037162EA7